MARMIFYATRSIDDRRASGTRLRPRAMRAAFRALGYEVEDVTGAMESRIEAMRRVQDGIEAGAQYDFLYMENSTQPLHLCEPRLHLLRRHPLADAAFLRRCRRHGVPIGVFNNDVHWRFSSYWARGNVRLRSRLRVPFYFLEYQLYGWLADVLYVPHTAMAAHLPGRFRRIETLPHGAEPDLNDERDTEPQASGRDALEIFYVGGIGAFYRLHSLFEAVRRVEGVHLTVCCRADEWQRWQSSYAGLMSDRVQVVHAQGEALQPYFRRADILSCFLAPDPYWRATFPLKLFEYLGYGKPILAAQDTNAGDFVRTRGLGWALPDEPAPLAELLARLRRQPDELKDIAALVRRLLPEHTWQARARQVAASLDRARLNKRAAT